MSNEEVEDETSIDAEIPTTETAQSNHATVIHNRRPTVEPIRAGVLENITVALRKKEGFRHLWLGDSGMGKTAANRILIEWVLKNKLVDQVLTIDNKDRWKSQYDGCFRANPQHLRQEPPKSNEETRHIVFRGIALTRSLEHDVDINDVAKMGWDMVRLMPCSVLINIDELADATNGHQSWSSEEVPQIYRKGRGVGYSVTATTQLPQLLPREAFGLPDTIGIFRMTAREASYLKNYRVITEEEINEIASLEIGQFRLYRKSFPVDRNIYKFKL